LIVPLAPLTDKQLCEAAEPAQPSEADTLIVPRNFAAGFTPMSSPITNSTTSARLPRRLQVVIAFGLVYVLWGSTYLAIRIVVQHLSPLTMGALRSTTAGVLMLSFRAATGNRIRVGWRDLLRLALIGFLLLVGSNVVMGWGEIYVPTGLAALLVAVVPLWLLVLDRLTQSTDRLSARGVTGIALGVVGVAVLLWPGLAAQRAALGGRQLFGSLLVLIAGVSWAFGSILVRHWHMPIDSYAAAGWEMFFGGTISATLALATGRMQHEAWAQATSSLWAIVYLIAAGSLVGFSAYVWLLKNVPIAKVATYAYVNPIIALMLGYFFHGERMDVYMLAGAVVVVVSVILVTGAKVRHEAREEEALELEPIEPSGD
jgi:drug/metabolite transporter (DMT)-like permease